MNLRKRQLLGIISFLSVMTTVAILHYTSISSLIKTNDWVAHTHRVISFGNLIQKLLVDMETGERGFLITGKNNFLEPYEKGKKEYQLVIAHTKNLVSDNPDQLELLEEIDALAHKWEKVAATLEISTRMELNKDKDSFDAVKTLIENETGKTVMDDLRTKLLKFNSVEEKLLTTRRNDSKKAARLSIVCAIFGTSLATIIGLFTISFSYRKEGAGFQENKDESCVSGETDNRNIKLNNFLHSPFVPMIIVLLFCLSPIVYVFNNPVEDKEITEGKGYGFEIGDNKLIAYEHASQLKSEGKIYGIRVGEDKNHYKIFTDMSMSKYLILKYYDIWHIEYNVKRIGMNTILLSFVDNKLQKISKHYQAMVLPDFIQKFFVEE